MNVTPPSASALSWNGDAFVVATSRTLPPVTLTMWLPRAAASPPLTGIAEVTWPATETFDFTLPVAAATVTRRLSADFAVSSVRAVNTASSPWPQPGEK